MSGFHRDLLLSLDKAPVGIVERPLGRAVRYPAGRSGLPVAAFGDLPRRLFGVAFRLVLTPSASPVPMCHIGTRRLQFIQVGSTSLHGYLGIGLPVAPDYNRSS